MISRAEAQAISSVASLTPRQVLGRDDPAAPAVAERLERSMHRIIRGLTPKATMGDHGPHRLDLRANIGLLDADVLASLAVASKTAATRSAPTSGSMGDALHADVPIEVHPDFQEALEANSFYRLDQVGAFTLSDATLARIFDRGHRLATLEEHHLDALITDGVLNASEAGELRSRISVRRLLDDRDGLLADAWNLHGIDEADKLVSLGGDQWLKLVGRLAVEEIPTETHAQYAQLLARQAAQIFPAAAMANRLREGLVSVADLAALDDLVKKHGATISVENDIFEPGTMSDPVHESAARAMHARLVNLTRRFPGWSVGAILDGAGTPESRRAALMSAVAHVAQLFDEHPAILKMDLTGDAAALDGFLPKQDSGERTRILDVAKAAQRMWRVTDDVDDTLRLLDAGIRSAHELLNAGKKALLAALDINSEHAERLVDKAAYEVAKTGPLVSELLDRRGLSATTYTRDIDSELGALFRALPNYEQLFGNQSFCHCSHCRSILSPAAYLVDTLRFVEDTVSSAHFDADDHPLHLRARRPDLWTLPLSCENTHSSVSTLSLVVERLEETAARAFHNGDDAASVERVYTETLAWSTLGPTLPFDRDGVRMQRMLDIKGVDFIDVARLFALDGAEVRERAALGLTRAERAAIVNTDSTVATLEARYGLGFEVVGDDVAPVEAIELASALGMDRERLVEFLAAPFVVRDAAVSVDLGKRSPESVQFDVERVVGLTLMVLDRLERFGRLHRAVRLDVTTLDFLLRAIGETSFPDLGSILPPLGRLRALLEGGPDHTLRTAELLAMAMVPGAVPLLYGVDLIDLRFNSAAQLELHAGPWPPAAPVTIDLDPTALQQFNNAAPLVRLAAGLELDVDVTLRLVELLRGPLGMGETTELVLNPPQGAETHSAELTLLLRHAALIELFDLTPETLMALFAPATGGFGDAYHTLDDLLALDDFIRQVAASGLTTDEVLALTISPEAGEAELEIAEEIIKDVHADRAHRFPPTLLASIEGLDEAQSVAIVEQHADAGGPFVTVGTEYHLAAGYNPSQLALGDHEPLREEIEAVLAHYTPGGLIAPRIGDRLGLPVERVMAMLRLVYDQDFDGSTDEDPFDVPLVVAALHQDGPTDDLARLVAEVQRLDQIFAAEVFTADRLDFLRAHPRLVDPEVMPWRLLTPTPSMQLRMAAYRRLLDDWQARPGGVDRLDEGLAVLMDQGIGSEAKLDGLSLAFGCERSTMKAICDRVAPVGMMEYLADFEAYGDALELTRTLGVDVPTLDELVGDDPMAFSRAVERLTVAVGLEDDSAELARRRDALVTLLTRSSTTPYRHARDLSAALLIDVEVGGCVETTRVASAIDAVQTYVHRVRMNLETSGPGVVPAVTIPPSAVPAEAWAWRKNYRVWEANRKVFLYPENYLEPGVRDDKTPLFEEFEAALASREPDQTAIEDAYGRYLRGFEALGRLRIGGAYHQVGDGTDVMHLFGVDSQDPPNWYYRRVDDLEHGTPGSSRGTRWGYWTPLDIKIPVRQVSPWVHKGRLHVFWIQFITRPRPTRAGQSFSGYKHVAMLHFVVQRADGSWSTPQLLTGDAAGFYAETGVVEDVPEQNGRLTFAGVKHDEFRENYTLRGDEWTVVHPHGDPGSTERLALRGLRFQRDHFIDFATNQLKGFASWGSDLRPNDPPRYGDAELLIASAENPADRMPRRLWSEHQEGEGWSVRLVHAARWSAPMFEEESFAWLVIDADRGREVAEGYPADDRGRWTDQAQFWLGSAIVPEQSELLVSFPEDEANVIEPVRGRPQDAVLRVDHALLHLQESGASDGRYLLRRLDTGVAETLTATLFNHGLAHLLSYESQSALKEPAVPMGVIAAQVADHTGADALDFNGPMGVYLREIFLHIPLALARRLQAEGQHELAQRWYAVVFDPTAPDEPIDPSLPDDERERRVLDRVWRFRGFRDLDVESMRDVLTDREAIATYLRDPFNPHAIARVRPSAYQKSVVQKTVDNLIDWADMLFARETRESLAEAHQLYAIAGEILGPRPHALGDCVEDTQMSYADIMAQSVQRSAFLREVETFAQPTSSTPVTGWPTAAGTRIAAQRARQREAAASGGPVLDGPKSEVMPVDKMIDVVAPTTPRGPREFARWIDSVEEQFGPVFCVPANAQLLERWDRLEDRLYKLRNCLRLDGSVRSTAAFAPPIDPGALVNARASGMPLGNLRAFGQQTIPPYRFQAMIGRAKQYAATVQRLGASLLTTLERRDGEALAKLRQEQSQTISDLTTEIRTRELEAADAAIAALERQRGAIEYRRQHYTELIQEGNLDAENTERDNRELAQALQLQASLVQTAAAFPHLSPTIGAWVIALFGGNNVGHHIQAIAGGLGMAAGVLDMEASRAGGRAARARRKQSWLHQQALAEKDLEILEPQLAAARTQRRIAERASLIHERSLAHTQDVLDYLDARATNAALYSTLADALAQGYRRAYDAALRFARLAEAAYRFERDDASAAIGNHWRADRGGLLAGDGLMFDLERLERRFIETHGRVPEVNQNFALSQIDPRALLRLRKEGATTFSIPTYIFDLHYPGHYRRRIKGARLTIACTGEITTNISARLTLVEGRMRTIADAATVPVIGPRSLSTTMATSTGEGDAGVFVFDFNGERYMPFEGAGAISRWQLALPRTLRPFDYGAISDVVLNMSYVARDDAILRDTLEGEGDDTLVDVVNRDRVRWAFSLREHASSAFYTLSNGDGASVTVLIEDEHLPYFLRGRTVIFEEQTLIVETDLEMGGTLAIGAAPGVALAPDPDPAGGDFVGTGMPSASVAGLTIGDPIQLALTGDGDWNAGAIRDIVIVMTLTIDPAGGA